MGRIQIPRQYLYTGYGTTVPCDNNATTADSCRNRTRAPHRQAKSSESIYIQQDTCVVNDQCRQLFFVLFVLVGTVLLTSLAALHACHIELLPPKIPNTRWKYVETDSNEKSLRLWMEMVLCVMLAMNIYRVWLNHHNICNKGQVVVFEYYYMWGVEKLLGCL